jgi:hypothetical protein
MARHVGATVKPRGIKERLTTSTGGGNPPIERRLRNCPGTLDTGDSIPGNIRATTRSGVAAGATPKAHDERREAERRKHSFGRPGTVKARSA